MLNTEGPHFGNESCAPNGGSGSVAVIARPTRTARDQSHPGPAIAPHLNLSIGASADPRNATLRSVRRASQGERPRADSLRPT